MPEHYKPFICPVADLSRGAAAVHFRNDDAPARDPRRGVVATPP